MPVKKRVRRIVIGGAPQMTDALKEWADAIDAAQALTFNLPLQSTQGPLGNQIVSWNGESGIRLAVLTATLTNGTPTTPTSAAAVFQTFDGTTISSAVEPLVVYNYHDKTAANGSLILVVKIMQYWFMIDIYSCTALS